VGVTVLTSLNDHVLAQVGVTDGAAAQVTRLTKLSADCGLAGVVCSAQELSLVRSHLPAHGLTVTPGIRPVGAAVNDQSRVLTPGEAVRDGASYLVVGRPITQVNDPMLALESILSDITQAQHAG